MEYDTLIRTAKALRVVTKTNGMISAYHVNKLNILTLSTEGVHFQEFMDSWHIL